MAVEGKEPVGGREIVKKAVSIIMTLAICVMLLTACGNSGRLSGNMDVQEQVVEKSAVMNTGPESTGNIDNGQIGAVTMGTEYEEGFLTDNVLMFNQAGEYADVEDLHYHIYVPDSYDGTRPYALYITLPGYEAYYFQGVAANLKMENFATEAKKYKEDMIIVAPQPNDWGENSKWQTIGLTEYLLTAYNIDSKRVYISGLSGGGETLSLAVSEKPELYAAALYISSKWDGSLGKITETGTPIYFAIGEDDEYYGSEPVKETYAELFSMYEQAGLSEDAIRQHIILDIKDRSYFSGRGVSNQHGGGLLFAWDEAVMGWLFGEH